MTKNQYIDFIRNSLPMVDKTSRFHREQVAAAINVAVDTVFYEMYAKSPKAMRKSMDRYATEVSGTITAVGSTGRYGTSLSVDVVDLPRKAGGVLQINWDTLTSPDLTPRSNTTKFVPVSAIESEQLYGAEGTLVGNVETAGIRQIIGFTFSGPRTIFYWDMSEYESESNVLIRLIKQFRSYSATEQVLMPFGQDQRIIQLVREYLGVIPPKDLVNNNADMIPNG